MTINPTLKADKKIQEITADIKKAAETRSGHHYKQFEAMVFRIQDLPTRYYFIKVKTDSNKCNIYKVYIPPTKNGLPSKPKIISVLENKPIDMAVVIF